MLSCCYLLLMDSLSTYVELSATNLRALKGAHVESNRFEMCWYVNQS